MVSVFSEDKPKSDRIFYIVGTIHELSLPIYKPNIFVNEKGVNWLFLFSGRKT
jgi:hypothetical protein